MVTKAAPVRTFGALPAEKGARCSREAVTEAGTAGATGGRQRPGHGDPWGRAPLQNTQLSRMLPLGAGWFWRNSQHVNTVLQVLIIHRGF